MTDHKEILAKLPNDWSEVSLELYMKTVDIEVSDELTHIFGESDNTIKVVSALSGVGVPELEDLPLSQLAELTKKISFALKTLPDEQTVTTLEWKTVEDMTYSDFVLYSNLSKEENGLIRYLPNIIQAFLKTKLTMEQVLALPMPEVWGGFFTLEASTKQYLKRTATCLKKRIRKQKWKETLTRFKRKLTGKGQ